MMSQPRILVCTLGASDSTEIKEPKSPTESRGRSKSLHREIQITHMSTQSLEVQPDPQGPQGTLSVSLQKTQNSIIPLMISLFF